MDFKAGDTVKLKSGGEKMTVEDVRDGLVDCVWFNDKKVERASFPPVVLKKFDGSIGSRAIGVSY